MGAVAILFPMYTLENKSRTFMEYSQLKEIECMHLNVLETVKKNGNADIDDVAVK